IEQLKTHTRVFELRGDTDHRLRVLERAEIYHVPLDREAENSLSRSFAALAPDKTEHDVILEIEGRPLLARCVADDVVWFDFSEICEGPRSQNDYIEISRIYHAVLISNVPRFTARSEDAARRFISLVDEFYDHNVKLIISAESNPTELYGGERLRFEFRRTESRLLEMQSHQYLARIHLA
ncbi:MAG: cell division protein ZapE, partial [Gammaproteobacteria bacterium]|nr:cell division protein ZapE [Gammaproteobacteria bacterium]